MFNFSLFNSSQFNGISSLVNKSLSSAPRIFIAKTKSNIFIPQSKSFAITSIDADALIDADAPVDAGTVYILGHIARAKVGDTIKAIPLIGVENVS